MNLDFVVKCVCGVITHTDAERIMHDCNYYPQDIIDRDELWDQA